MEEVVAFVDARQQDVAEVERPNPIIDFLETDDVLREGIGDEEQALLEPDRPNFGRRTGGRISGMSIEEIEAEALKLDPKARARLAERLLESLETLSDQENERLC